MRNRTIGVVLVGLAVICVISGVFLLFSAITTGLVTVPSLIGIGLIAIAAILAVFGAIGLGLGTDKNR